MKAIYANSIEDLGVKTMGLFHDHCHHYYYGKIKDLPEKYKQYKTKDKYILIYKED